MKHDLSLTRAAAALLAAGATFHVKEAADPIEVLTKNFGEHITATMKKLGATDDQLKALGSRLLDLEQKSVRVRGRSDERPESWGGQIVHSEQFKAAGVNGQDWRGRLRIGVKATITSLTTDAAGSAGDLVVPDYQRDPILMTRRTPRLRALFMPGQTTSNAIFWPKMTGRTKGAAGQAEGTTKGQSDIKFDLLTWPVKTIAHFMIASKQILDDAPALASIIDGELTADLKDVEEDQFLNGSGVGEDLTGVYTTATAFAAPFDAPLNINMMDVLLQAIAQCDIANYQTDGIVLNPLDWRMIQSLKDDQSRYLGAGPFGDLVARLWQMPIVPTTAMTKGEFLVGAFRQGAQIFDRQEAIVEVSTEDSDNFRKNLVTVRGEERLAFVIKYPDAFIKGDFEAAMFG